jgi:hypothetical protein
VTDMYTSVTITVPEGLEIDLDTLRDKIEDHIDVDLGHSWMAESLDHGGHWDEKRRQTIPHLNEAHFSDSSKFEMAPQGSWLELSAELGPHYSITVYEDWRGEGPSETTTTYRGGEVVADESLHQVEVTNDFDDALADAVAWITAEGDHAVFSRLLRTLGAKIPEKVA